VPKSALILVALSAPHVFGQVPEAFDVVSIKRNLTDGDRAIPTSRTPGRFYYPNLTVMRLIRTAFNLRSFQISGGPAWLNTEKYDIEAKTEVPTTIDMAQLRPALQKILTERFNLKVRHDAKELPVYTLVVAGNGPRLKQNAGAEGLPQRVSWDAVYFS
jgi:uncharacterized protein (TIGR03435 family)